MSSNASLKSQSELNEGEKIVVDGNNNARYHYKPANAPRFEDEQEALILSAANHPKIKAKRSFWFRFAQTVGILASLAWGAICLTYMIAQGGLATQTPYEMGIFVAGMLAPVAFYWMLLSYMQRNSDVQYYAQSMRAELHSLFFPSEEDSKRVNKDIERMTNQAAELAASSRAALKSISRTRQGLRHEIKEFANFASKAENHLINLSSTLSGRVGGVSELVDEIENRIAMIADKSEKGITSWDEATARMVERASDIEIAMDKGANGILSMAEVAQEKSQAVSDVFDGTITSLGLTVDAMMERLGGINEDFSGYTRTLQVSTEDLAKETNRIGLMIEDQIDQLQGAAGKGAELITTALISVSDQKDALDDATDALTAKAQTMSNTIEQSVVKLNDIAEDVVSRAEMTGEKLSDKAQMISTSLDGLETQIDRIDSASEIASHRLSEGIETAVNGATQVSDSIRRGVELLTSSSNDATAEATNIIEAAVSHIQQLKEAGQGNVRSVENMVELLDKSRKQIEQSSITAQGHVDMLSKATESQGKQLEMSAVSLAEEVKNISRAIEEPMKAVSIAVADADGRHKQISETLERRVSELREASDKATQSVDIIRTSLREQTNDISALSGSIISQSKTLNAELAENKEFLTETIDLSLSDMNRLMDNITDKTSLISSNAMNFTGQIISATETIEVMSSRLNDSSNLTTNALQEAGKAFLTQAETLEETIGKSESRIAQANDNLSMSCEKILPLYDRVEAKSVKASETLTTMNADYVQSSELAISKIELVSLEFDKRLNQLQDGSAKASDILKSTTHDLHEKLGDIEYAATLANDKLRAMTSAMDAQSSDIHILTDQAVLKIENIQNLIHAQFQELGTSVSQAVNQIEEAGLTFDSRSVKISDQANVILNRFETAGDVAQTKTHELKQASIKIGEVSKDVVTEISNQMSILNKASDQSLSNIRKTSDSLSIKSREIDTMMQSVLGKSKSYADDMRDKVREIANESDNSVTSISKSATSLMHVIDEVNAKTQSAMGDIASTNQSLYDQSGRFVTAVAKSAQAAEHATELFSKQTDNLLKASRVAVEKTAEIQNAELRASRETFLSSARFVLESLHSLSIDFIRMFDGSVDDKEWKAYQKGDIALFTSKLASRLNEMPADKIRAKYADDTEFRNYVQKFMRQFEDVLEQTDTVDRGAVLGTTFAASDVGKIYRFLCNVTGRDNKAIVA